MRDKKTSITTTLMKNKSKIFTMVKSDFSSSKNFAELKNARIRRYRDIYEDNGEYGASKKDNKIKSKYRSQEFKKRLRNIVPAIAEPLISSQDMFDIDLMAGSDDYEKEVYSSAILNSQMSSIPNKNTFINKLAKVFVVDGTCIVKTEWDQETKIESTQEDYPVYADSDEERFSFLDSLDDERREVAVNLLNSGKDIPVRFDSRTIETEKIVVNRPSHSHIDSLRIVFDPRAEDCIDDAQFAIEHIRTNISQLKSDSRYFSLKELSVSIQKDVSESEDYHYDREYHKTDFSFSDAARREIDIIEYWGMIPIDGDAGELVPVVVSWCGDILIRLEENPFPHKKIPYSVASYEPMSGTIFGESDAEIIYQDQIGSSLSTRAIQNVMMNSENSQTFIESGFLPDAIQQQNYKSGRDVIFKSGKDPQKSIYKHVVNDVPAVLFTMKGSYQNSVSASLGSMESSTQEQSVTTGATHFMDGSDNRQQSVVGRFSSMWENIGKLMSSMNSEFLLSTDTVIVSGKKYNIDIKRIMSSDMLKISVETISVKQKRAAGIMNLMKTQSANMSPRVAGLHYAKVAALTGSIDLSLEVLEETKEKEPTEQEKFIQEMEMERIKLENKKVELEIVKLEAESKAESARANDFNGKAEISGNIVSSGKIDAEASLSRAKASEALEAGRKMVQQTKLFENQFSLEESGEKRQRDKDDNEYQHAANLEREEVRTKRELQLKDKNEDGKISKEEEADYLWDYIKNGTIKNQSYDPLGDVYRNIGN